MGAWLVGYAKARGLTITQAIERALEKQAGRDRHAPPPEAPTDDR